jgi:hypothetical protein
MNWFYEYNGEQKGPVPEDELDRLIAQGTVLPTTLVWRDGLPNWTPLAQVRATSAPAGGFAAQPGMTRCDSCGRFFEPADVVQISGRNICAGCKPAVLQGLQQGTLLAAFDDPARVGPAWEQQESLGTYVAARDTIKAALMEPSHTFATMKVDGGIMKPFWFHTIFGGLGNFLFIFYVIVAVFIFGAFYGNKIDFPTGGGMFILITVIVAIWCFMSAAINGFLQAGIIHVCLMMCGGARRPYEATFRAICYGSGSAMMLMAIPIVGFLLFIPWSIVVSCISVARAHETDLWRAVLAMFMPGIVCCVLQLFFTLLSIGLGGSH